MSAPLASVEAEQSVIGAVLIDNGALDRIAAPLLAEHFSREDHRRIWRAIMRLIGAGRPADVVTVFEAMESSGEASICGGLAYLGEIAMATHSAANVRRPPCADQSHDRPPDAAVILPAEVLCQQGRGDAIQRAVVDQYGADDRLLGFDGGQRGAHAATSSRR